MIEAAETLIGQGWPFVRVDFYEIDDEPKFGELTSYPNAGGGSAHSTRRNMTATLAIFGLCGPTEAQDHRLGRMGAGEEVPLIDDKQFMALRPRKMPMKTNGCDSLTPGSDRTGNAQVTIALRIAPAMSIPGTSAGRSQDRTLRLYRPPPPTLRAQAKTGRPTFSALSSHTQGWIGEKYTHSAVQARMAIAMMVAALTGSLMTCRSRLPETTHRRMLQSQDISAAKAMGTHRFNLGRTLDNHHHQHGE